MILSFHGEDSIFQSNGKKGGGVEKFIRNFLAIGLGSFIGSEVALRISGRFFWAGLIVGGIFGYLSVDFREVVAAVRSAFKTVFGFKLTEVQKACWFMVFMMLLNAAVFVLIGLVSNRWIFTTEAVQNRFFTSLIMYSVFSIFAGIFMGMFKTIELRDEGRLPEVDRAIDVSICRIAVRYLNPVKAVYYWPLMGLIYFGKGILWAIPRFPKGVYRIGLFGKTVFATIHNDKRLVRLYYCVIGSAIGYAYSWPLAGFLIGGLVGAVCTWIIPMLLTPKSQEAAP
jgi:hypothetical protein